MTCQQDRDVKAAGFRRASGIGRHYSPRHQRALDPRLRLGDVMAGLDWDQEWKDARKFFETETKASAAVDGVKAKHVAALEKQIASIKKLRVKAEGLANQLKDKQDLLPAANNAIVEYEKAVTVFRGGIAKYGIALEAAITKAKDANQQQKNAWTRALKFLSRQLSAILESMEGQTGYLRSRLRQEDANTQTANNTIKSIATAATKCLAAAGKVKAKPTKDTFQAVHLPARDLNQFIGNITKLRNKGFSFSARLNDAVLKTHFEAIRPYAADDYLNLIPDGAPPPVVMRQLGEFTKAVKAARDYVTANA
jgi:hypothetical protein